MSTPTLGPGTKPQPRRILVVEDHLDGRESLRKLLEYIGFEVDLAEDGPEGVARALSGRPDIVLLDIGLPRLDGFQVAQQIRMYLGDRPHLIACTAFNDPEDRQRAEQVGIDEYMVKPVDIDQLERVLREAIAREG